MCTVSIVPHARGMRIVCNRDERRDRPPAEPPAVRGIRGTATLWPRDPVSGGTWIAANDAGVAFVILNRHDGSARVAGPARQSRGTIIPRLIRSIALDDVQRGVERLSPEMYEPFTLLAVHRQSLMIARNTADGMQCAHRRIVAPCVFTSSSLGDERVHMPRRRLFRRLVQGARAPLRAQAAFHRHFWPARRDISIWMIRREAATVSRTTVEVGRRSIRMVHEPLLC